MEERLVGYSRKAGKVMRRQGGAKPQVKDVPASVASLRMRVIGADPAAKIEASDLLASRVNYFVGNDPRKWHLGVKQFARVSYHNIYPGVDLAYHGQHGQLEFDFELAPNASAAPIGLGFSGAQRMVTDSDGNLVLTLPTGNLTLHKPFAYQQSNGHRQAVEARFVLRAHNQVGLDVGSYDRSRTLVIDPTLTYGTYLGGNGDDEAYGIALDTAGNTYITGESNSTSGFPGGDPTHGGYDAFVVKLKSDGTFGYTTFVGGSGDDLGSAIAVNPATGAAYVGGITTSTDLPTTAGAKQSSSGSPANSNCVSGANNVSAPCTDAFVFELSPTGSTVYLTYLGGNNDDGAFGVALDTSGNAYVTGFTASANFPVASALYELLNNGVASNPPFEDAFVTEVNPSGTDWVYSTFLGGQNNDFGSGISVDSSGNAYVAGGTYSIDFPFSTGAFQTQCGTDGNCNATTTGQIYSDAFVTKLSASGAALSYSTYLGGSSDDFGTAVALDTSGQIYVTGQTTDDNTGAGDFPVVAGGFSSQYGNGNASASGNGFVSKINPAGGGSSDLVYSSYLGGSTFDSGLGIAVDSLNNAYVTGSTLSSDFPSTGGFQTALNGDSDAFITQVGPGGVSLGYSSYLGGSGDENYDMTNGAFLGGAVALDSSANVYLTGSTSSSGTTSLTEFPLAGTPLQGAFGGGPFDAFAAIVGPSTTPNFTLSATTPATVAPGASGTSTVTLAELNGYSSSVNLTCGVSGTGSPLPACSFSKNSVTPTASGATSTLTITTTGSSASLVRPSRLFYALWLPIAGLSIIGMGLSSAPTRRKKLLGFLLVGVVMAALALMPACGGSSNSGGGGGGGCTGCTPAGSYTVTITGTGTDAGTTTHTYPVTLTVN
jgi:hypothetical protein